MRCASQCAAVMSHASKRFSSRDAVSGAAGQGARPLPPSHSGRSFAHSFDDETTLVMHTGLKRTTPAKPWSTTESTLPSVIVQADAPAPAPAPPTTGATPQTAVWRSSATVIMQRPSPPAVARRRKLEAHRALSVSAWLALALLIGIAAVKGEPRLEAAVSHALGPFDSARAFAR